MGMMAAGMMASRAQQGQSAINGNFASTLLAHIKQRRRLKPKNPQPQPAHLTQPPTVGTA